jgi:Lipid A 3-O-deacylase (PagL)
MQRLFSTYPNVQSEAGFFRIALILVTIAVAAPAPAQDASSQPAESPSRKASAWLSHIMDGHLALGAGTTYQYDGSKGSNLGVASWTSSDDNYELAAFRFFTTQMRRGDPLAEANWIFEASRRWRLHWKLIDRSGLDLFFGFGAAYKTKTDCLDGSNWNFAEQLGWRFPRLPSGGRLEFAIRHVSNAGLKKPNKGEDFLTLAYVF